MLFGPWQITLLGTLTARNGSLLVTRFRTRQTAMLLACLAFSPGRSHSREELADRFWPEETPQAARTNLRVALSSLRRQMEPPGMPAGSVLMADRNCICLCPKSFTTDVGPFRAALRMPTGKEPLSARAARLSRVIALYGGDLLLGGYDEWVLREREALAAQYRWALGQLLETWEALGEKERTCECAHRLIDVDPLAERGYLALMRLAVQAGEPALALREFNRMERLLGRTLEVAPSEEALKVVEMVRASRSTSHLLSEHAIVRALPSPPVMPAPEATSPLCALPLFWAQFFEQMAKQEALLGLLADGKTRLITLTGPGGAGKTRLAMEVGRRLVETFPGPICFVSLADVLSAPLLPKAIAASLCLAGVRTGPPLDQIIEALKGRSVLLVLDNLEQIADESAPIVQSLLTRLPGLCCLVTSRRSLNLPGERVFPLPPLPTPLYVESPERLLA